MTERMSDFTRDKHIKNFFMEQYNIVESKQRKCWQFSLTPSHLKIQELGPRQSLPKLGSADLFSPNWSWGMVFSESEK